MSPAKAALFAPRCWPVWCLVGFAWLIARLPLPAILTIGRLTGRVLYRISGWINASRRRVTEINIALCFPELSETEQARLARDSFIHTAIGAFETTQPWLHPSRDLSDRIRLHGMEHVEAAAALGRGVILVGGHFTAMDIVSQGLSRSMSLDVVYRGNRHPVWEWLQVTGRERWFDAVIERSDARRLLRRLRSGHIVWYAPDQDYGARRSVFVPFFGVQAATINATARLAAFNDSPVVFMSNFRDLREMTWSVHFSPALTDFPSADAKADAARINRLIEDAVRQHPEQYLWMHRRFKTRPPGVTRVY